VRNLVLCNAQFGLIRRSALERTRLHGSYPSSDHVLLAELALLGKFWEIPEALFFRRKTLRCQDSRIAPPQMSPIYSSPGLEGTNPEEQNLFESFGGFSVGTFARSIHHP
jgi:hypothetical protein